MTKDAMTILWILVAVALIVAAGAWLARTPVLQGRLLPELRWIYALVAPPEDYFSRLSVLPISLAKPGSIGTLKFQHKYVGKHIIGLLTSRPIPQGVPSYQASFRLLINCLAGDRSVFEKQIGTVSRPWWSRSESGFMLLDYEVPKDLPFDQEIECIVRVEVADPDFELRYGPVSVFVRKDSEK